MQIKTFKKQLTSNKVKQDETPTNKKNDYKVLHIKRPKAACKSTKKYQYAYREY